MKYTQNNLLHALDMFDVILHGCNCFHTMGAGIAGGEWDRIAAIIEDELGDEDVTVVKL